MQPFYSKTRVTLEQFARAQFKRLARLLARDVVWGGGHDCSDVLLREIIGMWLAGARDGGER